MFILSEKGKVFNRKSEGDKMPKLTTIEEERNFKEKYAISTYRDRLFLEKINVFGDSTLVAEELGNGHIRIETVLLDKDGVKSLSKFIELIKKDTER